MPDAFWPALLVDALVNWRGLFEPFGKTQGRLGELARLSFCASTSFHKAGLGVNGFGSFCRNKRASAAGPKPGITRTFQQSSW